MKTKSILICLLFAITANSFTAAKAQVNVTDSLALVDFYNSTDGPKWYNHTNWLTTAPLNTWYGISLSFYRDRVQYISLSYNNLAGTIPASIGNLTALYDLYLPYNNLSGAIPTTLGNLTYVHYLELDNNQLSGAIPAEIGKLSNLGYLNLGSNQLSGTIPPEIGNLTYLSTLYLYRNQLSGTIPPEIGNLKYLNYLALDNNQLSGTIPAEIGSCKRLAGLYISYNQLSGTVPAALKKLTNLRSLDLSYNRLSAFGYAGSFTKLHHKFYGSVNNNLFTFDGLQVIAKNFRNSVYAPQDTILPIHKSGNVLSLSAGGMLSNNKYKWFKAGSTDSITIKGDSTFHPTQSGNYYAKVTNAIATQLTLYSDTISYTTTLAQTQNSLANVAAVKAINSKFFIYPNPAKDIIHIVVNGNAIVTLTNSAGKILLSKTINNSDAISVSSFANGTYYIQNKTTGETQKVIVVH